MKATTKLMVLILTLFILSGCNNNINDADRIELYILRNIKGTNDFKIDDTPIITGNDILRYEWQTHTITFKNEFLSSRVSNETKDDLIMGGSKILGVYYPDQFAIYIDGEELYIGYIEPQVYISFMPLGPMISNAQNGIIIKCYDTDLDVRNSDKLYQILKNNGLLE